MPNLQPTKAWAFVTAAGLYILASIGPTTGAVMGWIERHRRHGLAELRQGASIEPVTIAPDRTRSGADATAQAMALRKIGQ